MARHSKYSPELRERAVRMVFDHAHEHASQWATIRSVAEKLGCTVEALRRWVRQAERDAWKRPGLTTDERQRLTQLERENVEPSGRRISSIGALRRPGRISSGSRTSPTWPPGAALSMWRSSLTSSRGASSGGVSRRPWRPISFSTRWSKRCTTAAVRGSRTWHHSDRGTQYVSMRYTDRLADVGIEPSVGSRGDAYTMPSPNR